MARATSLTLLLAAGALALTACTGGAGVSPSGGLDAAPSASAQSSSGAPASGSASQAPATEGSQTHGSQTHGSQTHGTTAAAADDAGLPSAVVQKASGLSRKVNGWLTGFEQSGCSSLDLGGQGQARGCLNQVKGAAGVTQGVSEALRHAGEVPADSQLGGALAAAEDLRSQWMSASCMRDVTAGECVTLAGQFPQALRTLGDALASAK